MKKIFVPVLLLLLAACLFFGVRAFIARQKSPKVVIKKINEFVNKSKSITYECDVKERIASQIGLFDLFNTDSPSVEIVLDYQVDMFRDTDVVHTVCNIGGLSNNSVKEFEVTTLEEDESQVTYYRWNKNWYKYKSESETSSISRNGIHLDRMIQEISEDPSTVKIDEETKEIDGKECLVLETLITGKQLDSYVGFCGRDGSIIPDLKDQELKGQLYVDRKTYEPVRLKISAEDFSSDIIEIEEFDMNVKVENIKICIDVKGYDLVDKASIPGEYVQLMHLDDLKEIDIIDVLLDISGLK